MLPIIAIVTEKESVLYRGLITIDSRIKRANGIYYVDVFDPATEPGTISACLSEKEFTILKLSETFAVHNDYHGQVEYIRDKYTPDLIGGAE